MLLKSLTCFLDNMDCDPMSVWFLLIHTWRDKGKQSNPNKAEQQGTLVMRQYISSRGEEEKNKRERPWLFNSLVLLTINGNILTMGFNCRTDSIRQLLRGPASAGLCYYFYMNYRRKWEAETIWLVKNPHLLCLNPFWEAQLVLMVQTQSLCGKTNSLSVQCKNWISLRLG